MNDLDTSLAAGGPIPCGHPVHLNHHGITQVITKPCPIEGGAPHVYPDDWVFGGWNAVHPGADPRWEPSTYEYYDAYIRLIIADQTPICDDVALDNCTQIAERHIDPPLYVFKVTPDGKRTKLPYEYDALTDTLHPIRP